MADRIRVYSPEKKREPASLPTVVPLFKPQVQQNIPSQVIAPPQRQMPVSSEAPGISSGGWSKLADPRIDYEKMGKVVAPDSPVDQKPIVETGGRDIPIIGEDDPYLKLLQQLALAQPWSKMAR